MAIEVSMTGDEAKGVDTVADKVVKNVYEAKGVHTVADEVLMNGIEVKGVHTVADEVLMNGVEAKGVHTVADEALMNGVEAKGVHTVADKILMNSVEGKGVHTVESFYDSETTTDKVLNLVQVVESLELEKAELAKRKEEVKEKERKLEEEALGLKTEKEKMDEFVKKAREDARALEAIAGRAAELETEVSILQHNLVIAMGDVDEGNAELRNVKNLLKETKSAAWELEKENESLREMFMGEIEKLKMVNSGAEERAGELESMIKEIGKIQLVAKDGHLRALEMKVAGLEAAVAIERFELQKEKAEKETLEVALKTSEAKVNELEAKLFQLQIRVEEAKNVIRKLVENDSTAANGVVNRDAVLVYGGSNNGMLLQWAVVAGATAAAAAAVMGGIKSLRYMRKR